MMSEYRDDFGAKRVSLRRDEFERGMIGTNTLAADLRKAEPPRIGDLTLEELFDNYEPEVTPTRSASKQANYKRARKVFVKCWGNA